MPIAIRSAKTTWTDSLAAGHGVIEVGTDGIDSLDVTWASRIRTRRAGPARRSSAPLPIRLASRWPWG